MELHLSDTGSTVCEDPSNEFNRPKTIVAEKEKENAYVQIYSFSVGARDWIRSSEIEKHVKVKIAAIDSSIIERGEVVIYMDESGKQIALPFTFYQLKEAILFQPWYDLAYIRINVFGNFILNNSVRYSFKVVVINARGMRHIKKGNTYNYTEINKLILL